MTNHNFVEPAGEKTTRWIDQLVDDVRARGRRAGKQITHESAANETALQSSSDKIEAACDHPEYQLCIELDEAVGEAVRCLKPGFGHLHHKWIGAVLTTMTNAS